TAANQISSTLLRLPAELRNRIWRFAVGGYIIMIKQRKTVGNMAFGTRRQPIDLTSTEHQCKTSMIDHKQGGQCETSTTSVAGLFTIGQTCRQIHAETVLLQYHFITFHFDHKDSIACFSAALTPPQLEAINTIALDPKGRFIEMITFPRWTSFVPKSISIPFPSLNYIIVAPSGTYSDRTLLKGYESCIAVETAHKKGLYLVCFDVFSGWMSLEGGSKLQVRLKYDKFREWDENGIEATS
ncbi:hypothetical protein BKA63DRAFT_405245, partial [Paraphoma chrysanthemicola]